MGMTSGYSLAIPWCVVMIVGYRSPLSLRCLIYGKILTGNKTGVTPQMSRYSGYSWKFSWMCWYVPPIRELVDGSWKMKLDKQSISSYVRQPPTLFRSGNSSPSMVEAVRLTSASRCDLASADQWKNPWLHPKWGLPLPTKTHGWSSISC